MAALAYTHWKYPCKRGRKATSLVGPDVTCDHCLHTIHSLAVLKGLDPKASYFPDDIMQFEMAASLPKYNRGKFLLKLNLVSSLWSNGPWRGSRWLKVGKDARVFLETLPPKFPDNARAIRRE